MTFFNSIPDLLKQANRVAAPVQGARDQPSSTQVALCVWEGGVDSTKADMVCWVVLSGAHSEIPVSFALPTRPLAKCPGS